MPFPEPPSIDETGDSTPSVVGIVLARLDSTRLPSKALLELGNGLTIIDLVLSRASQAPFDSVVLATTDRAVDDALAEHVSRQGIMVYRGELADVATRFVRSAGSADYAARINGDSPFVDPRLLAAGIELCKAEQPDVVTNLPGRTYPYGVAIEIVRVSTLVARIPEFDSEEREHVTRFLYSRSAEFQMEMMRSERPDLRGARMVVDTEEDFDLLLRLVARSSTPVVDLEWERAAELLLESQ